MRALILAAALAVALSACGRNGQTDTNQNVNEGLTAESIASNDVTAIDAVTGDAANMAADVDYTVVDNSLNLSGVRAAPTDRSARSRTQTKPPAESNTTTGTTAGNTAANATE